MPGRLIVFVCVTALLFATGCVRRTIRITSDPTGALVWVNDREVGRTPVEVDFVHYGTFDVRLRHDGYEPLHTGGDAKAPLWDLPGFDLVAEAVPGEPHVEIEWHFELTPLDDDPASLLDRARGLRDQTMDEAEDLDQTAGEVADEAGGDGAGSPESS